MDTVSRRKRNRLFALGFASVLFVLIYGPLSAWFVAADRMLYDLFASRMPNDALDSAVIVSIDPRPDVGESSLELYGELIAKLKSVDVKRIVLANPPDVDPDRLPAWATKLRDGPPVYVASGHPFAANATRSGFVDIVPDDDNVLRRQELWQLDDGVKSAVLPLAIAFDSADNEEATLGHRVSGEEDAVFLSSFQPLRRIEPDDIIFERINTRSLTGYTVFLDADPPLKNAVATLPSGQFATISEVTAALLAGFEQDRSIISPAWVGAMQWLAPVLLAIIAVLFLPDRGRRDILTMSVAIVIGLLLVDALLLWILKIRLDVGRAVLIFAGVAALNLWLVIDEKEVSRDAFKRASNFLAAGRLEPAFAELRRCPPSETIAAVMYKLSLAFEQQAKPERAEAVLEWMKRTHGSWAKEHKPGKKPGGIPRRLGRYVIEKRIGRGAMGAVYQVRDPRINRLLALKAIPIEKEFEDEELKEARLRFYREAESAGRLTHPNIITVYDAGEDKGLAYIAMEYVPGIPLKDFTQPNRLLAPKRALELAADTAEALDYAHNQGVIHRDIKPANLLYNPKEGSLKISDFGVARITDNNKTKTGIVLGTPMYMSPEQLGAEKLTGLSDLFSLGVTLYELLVGEVPFKATNIAVLMTKITTEDPAPIAGRRAGIPPSVDAILAKAMAKSPEQRFASGGEMAIALRNCAHHS